MPLQFTTLTDLRAEITQRKQQGQRIALVPTMGALHEGHMSLVRQAQKLADCVVVSIFVNPTQFGKNEDFNTYPRQLEQDIALLSAQKVDVAYLPDSSQIYPDSFATHISVSPTLTSVLCGAHRPGHFDGVCIVVAKLLLQSLADIALFGEKDFQQLQIIRRMVEDLNIPTQIIGAPTARAQDGLALSSRNQYLSPAEREIAPALYRILVHTAQVLHHIPENYNQQLTNAKNELIQAGFTSVDYLEWIDTDSLQPASHTTRSRRLLVAAYLGKTRLIDNIEA